MSLHDSLALARRSTQDKRLKYAQCPRGRRSKDAIDDAATLPRMRVSPVRASSAKGLMPDEDDATRSEMIGS